MKPCLICGTPVNVSCNQKVITCDNKACIKAAEEHTGVEGIAKQNTCSNCAMAFKTNCVYSGEVEYRCKSVKQPYLFVEADYSCEHFEQNG